MTTISEYESGGVLMRENAVPYDQSAAGLNATALVIGRGVPASSESDAAGIGVPQQVYDITSTADARKFFGRETESSLTRMLGDLFAQPAPPLRVKGMMAQPYEASAETPAANGSQLNNTPVVEDLGHVEVTDADGNQRIVEWSWDAPPETPGEEARADVRINPSTGDTAGFDANDEIVYHYLDYEAALTDRQLDRQWEEAQLGALAVDTDSQRVGSLLSDVINVLARNVRFLTGFIDAQPNATGTQRVVGPNGQLVDRPSPLIDIDNYQDPYDNQRLVAVGPSRVGNVYGTRRTALGAVVGQVYGLPLPESPFSNRLVGIGALTQDLSESVSSVADLADGGVPDTGPTRSQVAQFRDAGLLTLFDHKESGNRPVEIRSTSTTTALTDIPRDLDRRRVYDAIMRDVWPIADELSGEYITEDLLQNRREQIEQIFDRYISAGLIYETARGAAVGGLSEGQQAVQPTASAEREEQRAYFAVLQQTDTDEVSVALGVAVRGVGKNIVVDLYGGTPSAVRQAGLTQTEALGTVGVQNLQQAVPQGLRLA